MRGCRLNEDGRRKWPPALAGTVCLGTNHYFECLGHGHIYSVSTFETMVRGNIHCPAAHWQIQGHQLHVWEPCDQRNKLLSQSRVSGWSGNCGSTFRHNQNWTEYGGGIIRHLQQEPTTHSVMSLLDACRSDKKRLRQW
jgi:hypothetical protein